MAQARPLLFGAVLLTLVLPGHPLAPLSGLPLERLVLNSSKVADLAPLQLSRAVGARQLRSVAEHDPDH